jgi:hypothetical protein
MKAGLQLSNKDYQCKLAASERLQKTILRIRRRMNARCGE